MDNPIILEDGSLMDRRYLLTPEEMREYEATDKLIYDYLEAEAEIAAENAWLKHAENNTDYDDDPHSKYWLG